MKFNFLKAENEQSKICLGCGSEVMNGESEDEEIEEKMQRCCLCLEYGPESEMAYVDPNLEHEGQVREASDQINKKIKTL